MPLDLGCSKCRYSQGGCARCRSPSFRSRAAAPIDELRQAAGHQRQQQRRARRVARRQATAPARPPPAQPLLHQLRRHLEDDGTAPQQTSPHKYRRLQPPEPTEPSAPRPPGPVPTQPSRARPEKRPLPLSPGGHTPPRHPPSKYRRVAAEAASPEDELMQDASEAANAGQRGSSRSAGTAPTGNGSVGSGMEVDASSPPAPASTKRPFLAMLEDTMQRRRADRLSSTSPNVELTPHRSSKRQRTTLGSSDKHPDPRQVLWEPPVSPYGLLEEELWQDPWKLLVACMLLNKTTGAQVRKVVWDLFELCPTPQAALAMDVARIEALIQPLGLFRKRAVAIQRLSEDYLRPDWRDPTELFGIGRYATEAYLMFCRGRWRDVHPEDKDLRKYRDWLEATGGLGSGLTRHPAGGAQG